MTVTKHDNMSPKELAAWLKQEHDLVNELAATLSEKVALVPRTNEQAWIDGVREAFEHFRAHMTKHIALEEQGGYMEPVIEQRGALEPQVARLKHEHKEIVALMHATHSLLEDLQPQDRLIMRDICHRVQDILRYVDHHTQSENMLLLSAFTDEIGTKD